DQHNIVGSHFLERDELLAISILQKFYSMCGEIGIHLRVVDHLAEEVNLLSWILLHCAECNLDRVFHSVAETKMAREIDLNRSEIEKSGSEVLLHPVQLLPLPLDC